MYKEYQRECPHHGIRTYQIIQIFYGGLSPQGKSCLDTGDGGPIINVKEEEVVDIIEDGEALHGLARWWVRVNKQE